MDPPPDGWNCGEKARLEQLIHLFHKGVLLRGAHLLIHHLAVFEEEDGGDVADAILSDNGVVLVHIDFADGDAAVVFFGQLVDDGAYHAAGATPLCPKVEHHGATCAQHFLVVCI